MSIDQFPLRDLLKTQPNSGPIVNELDLNGIPPAAREDTVEIQQITPHETDLWHLYGQLRTEIYINRKKFLPEDAKNEKGEEFDDDDVRSIHITAVKDEKVVGATRLINRRENKELPIEEMFGIELAGPQLEISRMIVDRKAAGPQHKVAFLGLIRASMGEANRRGIEYVHAVVEKSLLAYLNAVGLKTEIVGEEQYLEEYNSVNIPIRISAQNLIENVNEADKRRKEKLAPFFRLQKVRHGLGKVAASDLKPNLAQFERNRGFISPEEQRVLYDSVVSIAGTGGDGGELAIGLARMGVAHFRLADPESFEVENINRQSGANYDTIGRNKAEVIAEEIYKINPWAQIEVYPDGINEDNIQEFVNNAHLVFDETEYTIPRLGIMIARAARQANTTVMVALNVGHGSRMVAFDPEGPTFESWLGLSEDVSINEVENADVGLDKWIGQIPAYANMNLFAKVQKGEMSAPSVVTGVLTAAADAISQAQELLLSRVAPERKNNVHYAPDMSYVDIKEHKAKIINSHSKFGFMASALRAIIRTKRKLNPPYNV